MADGDNLSAEQTDKLVHFQVLLLFLLLHYGIIF